MHYKYFPTIPIPTWLQSTGWADESWKQDASPRSSMVLPNARILSVWVDFEDASERECKDGGRYTVTAEDANPFMNDMTEIYSGDSEEEAQAAIARAIAENK
jgi:hypothetical protein